MVFTFLEERIPCTILTKFFDTWIILLNDLKYQDDFLEEVARWLFCASFMGEEILFHPRGFPSLRYG